MIFSLYILTFTYVNSRVHTRGDSWNVTYNLWNIAKISKMYRNLMKTLNLLFRYWFLPMSTIEYICEDITGMYPTATEIYGKYPKSTEILWKVLLFLFTYWLLPISTTECVYEDIGGMKPTTSEIWGEYTKCTEILWKTLNLLFTH